MKLVFCTSVLPSTAAGVFKLTETVENAFINAGRMQSNRCEAFGNLRIVSSHGIPDSVNFNQFIEDNLEKRL
jgi:hypothetical protein